jgi:hypothetical protein
MLPAAGRDPRSPTISHGPKMGAIVLWALAHGVITGGVCVGIVLVRRQRRLWKQQPLLLQDLQGRLEGLQNVERRLAEMEERLEFAERMLTKERDERLPASAESSDAEP